jgi:hypothetical protein
MKKDKREFIIKKEFNKDSNKGIYGYFFLKKNCNKKIREKFKIKVVGGFF